MQFERRLEKPTNGILTKITQTQKKMRRKKFEKKIPTRKKREITVWIVKEQ